MSSAVEKAGTAGIFNVKVYNGGNAICGPGASASISRTYYKSSCPLQHDKDRCYSRSVCYPSGAKKRSEKVQGPDQLITDLPAKVYQKLEVQLSGGQSDCKSLASHIFPKITQDEIEYLTRCPTNQAKGVFKKMSERGITLGQLVEALKSIEREDAIQTLIEAGYPMDDAHDDTVAIENDNYEEACSILEEETFLSIDETKEELPTHEGICIEKKSYKLIIEEPAITVTKKDFSSAPESSEKDDDTSQVLSSSLMRNIMSRVCLAQFPTSPEEKYTSVISIIEDIQRH